MIKRLVAFLLSFVLVFVTTPSFATTSTGGWTATDSLIAGANTTIEAVKTAGGKTLKSAVTVAGSATKVGKHLIKGGGQAALAYAVVELLGEGIDWVLDPANNAVKYKDPAASGGTAGAGADADNYKCYYSGANYPLTYVIGLYKPSYPNAAFVPSGGGGSVMSGSTVLVANCTRNINAPPFVPSAPVDKYIPIDTVAAKVISNAEAGHGPSQEVVKAAALEGFAAGEHDAALDAGATEVIPDTGVENPADPADPADPANPAEPKPVDLSPILGAINALKAMLAGILSSITDLADFFKSEPEPDPDPTELEIPLPDLPSPDTDITFGGSCPDDVGFTADFRVFKFDFVLMPFSKFCPLLNTYIKPVLVVLGSFMAISIVGGRRDV